MTRKDLKGVRLPGSVAEALRRPIEPKGQVWYLSDDEALDIHMALRYLRDHGVEGVSKARIVALISKIGRLPGHRG